MPLLHFAPGIGAGKVPTALWPAVDDLLSTLWLPTHTEVGVAETYIGDDGECAALIVITPIDLVINFSFDAEDYANYYAS